MISILNEYMKGKDRNGRVEWFNGIYLNTKSTNPEMSKIINKYDSAINKVANRVKRDEKKGLKL